MVKYPITRRMQAALLPFMRPFALQREKLRQQGDYETADMLRKLASQMGFDILDEKEGGSTVEPNLDTHWYIHYEVEGDEFPFTAKNMMDRITGISIEIKEIKDGDKWK